MLCCTTNVEGHCFELEGAGKKAIFDQPPARKCLILTLKKLTTEDLHLIIVDANPVKTTKQDYFESLTYCAFTEKFFLPIRNAALDTKTYMFHYKIVHNFLFFLKKCFSNLEK